MTLSVHPSAQQRYDEIALDLERSLRSDVRADRRGGGFFPDFHIAAELTEEDIIGDMKLSVVSSESGEVARQFSHGGETVSLSGKAHAAFQDLCQRIVRQPTWRDEVSLKSVQDAVFSWLEKRFKSSAGESLVAYLLDELASGIREREIWIPIASLSVECTVPVGRVVIVPLTKNIIDTWEARSTGSLVDKGQAAAVVGFFQRERKRIQGFAASVYKARGDSIRVTERAFEQTDVALGLVRFLCPASMSARKVSYCLPMGRENVPTSRSYEIIDSEFCGSRHGASDTSGGPWILTSDAIRQMRKDCLDVLTSIVRKNQPSNFETKLVEGFLLFSKVSTSQETADKVVYLSAAMESMLLKNDSEPIAQNLSERLALLVADELDERKVIVADVKKFYAMRSRFVHHAEEVSDIDAVTKVLVYWWRGLLTLLGASDQYSRLEDVIASIDDQKLR